MEDATTTATATWAAGQSAGAQLASRLIRSPYTHSDLLYKYTNDYIRSTDAPNCVTSDGRLSKFISTHFPTNISRQRNQLTVELYDELRRLQGCCEASRYTRRLQ